MKSPFLQTPRHIWNQRPRICLIASFGEETLCWKKWKTKNGLFIFFRVLLKPHNKLVYSHKLKENTQSSKNAIWLHKIANDITCFISANKRILAYKRVYLFIYLFIHLFICLFIYLSIYLFIYLFIQEYLYSIKQLQSYYNRLLSMSAPLKTLKY